MFPWGCGRKGCCQQVSEVVSDAYVLACEHRQTFSGHKSVLNRLHSNFTADAGNALPFLFRKIDQLTRHGRKVYLSVSFHQCHLASSMKQLARIRAGIFSVHLHLTMCLNILDRFCEIDVSCSPLPPPRSLNMLLSHCFCHYRRYQKTAPCEHVIIPMILRAAFRRVCSIREQWDP